MEYLDQFIGLFNTLDFAQLPATAGTSFTLITAAEMGDKSQLVCMTLASRHRPWPVVWGAVTAFVLLNTLAVVFGAVIANWLPDYLVAACIAFLFAGFGLHALWPHDEDDEDGDVVEKSGHSIFFGTFLLITVAEFGDKTQLAVVAFSSAAQPLAVWLGATLALVFCSALGVWAGRTVLRRIPLNWLHRISGMIFLTLACVATLKAYDGFMAHFAM